MEIHSRQRQYLATFKADERSDVHLRWTSTSALGRLSKNKNSTARIMAEATRAASKAIMESEDAELASLSATVQAKINKAGGGSFSRIHPGLDASLSSVSGNLSLYEKEIPLTNYGLGTRRISGLAVQQIASANKSLLLIDEIETGLEPHRLVRLMRYFLDDNDYSQIIITTHSPIAVEQASTENLAVVRTNGDKTSVAFLPNDDIALRTRRSRPSSFLANQILVVEGKTEEGILLFYIDVWDQERIGAGLPVAAGEGSAIQDGQGGSDAPLRASMLQDLGYTTAVFLDNDVRDVDKHVAEAEKKGITIIRCDTGNNLENQVVFDLAEDKLDDLLEVATQVRGDIETVLFDLHKYGLPETCHTLVVSNWISERFTMDDARSVISNAMTKKSWFKNIDDGKVLGKFIFENSDFFKKTTLIDNLELARMFLYPTDKVGEHEPAEK